MTVTTDPITQNDQDPTPRSKGKLLLVDDSSFVRRLFKVVFEELGYEVTTAADGFEGERLAVQQHFDVAVLDGVLPGRSGLDLCRTIMALPEDKRPATILYTIGWKGEGRYEALRSGADHYVRKDAAGMQLQELIPKLMAERGRRTLAA